MYTSFFPNTSVVILFPSGLDISDHMSLPHEYFGHIFIHVVPYSSNGTGTKLQFNQMTIFCLNLTLSLDKKENGAIDQIASYFKQLENRCRDAIFWEIRNLQEITNLTTTSSYHEILSKVAHVSIEDGVAAALLSLLYKNSSLTMLEAQYDTSNYYIPQVSPESEIYHEQVLIGNKSFYFLTCSPLNGDHSGLDWSGYLNPFPVSVWVAVLSSSCLVFAFLLFQNVVGGKHSQNFGESVSKTGLNVFSTLLDMAPSIYQTPSRIEFS